MFFIFLRSPVRVAVSSVSATEFGLIAYCASSVLAWDLGWVLLLEWSRRIVSNVLVSACCLMSASASGALKYFGWAVVICFVWRNLVSALVGVISDSRSFVDIAASTVFYRVLVVR